MTNVESQIQLYSFEKPLPQGAVFSYTPEVITQTQLAELLRKQDYFLLLIHGKQQARSLLKIKNNFHAFFRMIVVDSDFSTDDVAELLNVESVIKVLKFLPKSQPLDPHIASSLEVLKTLQESDNIITKVRVQNKVLSEINENLEDLVRQRTENLEQSKVAVESTLRGVKDLIKFVKNLSQINNFDDLIILLRQEFLKFHKMRAPLLVYSLGGAELRCIFFQGPQIIDQVLATDETPFFKNETNSVREALANALERPIGPILTLQFIFNDNKGVLVFEHSFSE
ncbi:MAG: hypothetical protein IT287_09560, partial [Bdellovibrionaceae bacterium]|nr:hypothetical protein [Pseudobdellovibrionaceae bacterium]